MMKTDKVEGTKLRLMSQGIHTEREEKSCTFQRHLLKSFLLSFYP